MIIYALTLMASSLILSPIVLIAGIGVFSYQTGLEFNFQANAYRSLTSFGPQKFGNWEKLPEIEYISVFKTTITHSVTSMTGNPTYQSSKVVQVNLIYNGRQKLLIYQGKNLEKAFGIAKSISNELNIDIWDATKRDQDWFKEN